MKFIERFKKNKELEEENEELKKIIENLKSLIGNPLEEMKYILGREIKWIDTDGMNFVEKKQWYDWAQMVIENPVIISLIGKGVGDSATNGEIAKDLLEYCARNTENMEQVNYWRSKVAGVELLRQYLNEIPDPVDKLPAEDLHSLI